jgi:hypothetical protein
VRQPSSAREASIGLTEGSCEQDRSYAGSIDPTPIVIKAGGGLFEHGLRWWRRPRLEVTLRPYDARPGSIGLFLANRGSTDADEVEVRVQTAEPCGACVQGGPRNVSLAEVADKRLPWPTGEAKGRIGPKSAESIHLCTGRLEAAESFAEIPVVGREPLDVMIATDPRWIEELDLTNPKASLPIPREWTHVISAPARVGFAVAGRGLPTQVMTLEIHVNQGTPRNGPEWMRAQAITYALVPGSIPPHPRVREQFPAANEPT